MKTNNAMQVAWAGGSLLKGYAGAHYYHQPP